MTCLPAYKQKVSSFLKPWNSAAGSTLGRDKTQNLQAHFLAPAFLSRPRRVLGHIQSCCLLASIGRGHESPSTFRQMRNHTKLKPEPSEQCLRAGLRPVFAKADVLHFLLLLLLLPPITLPSSLLPLAAFPTHFFIRALTSSTAIS